jgi:hypothetical protein
MTVAANPQARTPGAFNAAAPVMQQQSAVSDATTCASVYQMTQPGARRATYADYRAADATRAANGRSVTTYPIRTSSRPSILSAPNADLRLGESMTVQFRAGKQRPVRQALAQLKLDDVQVMRNGAHPQVVLVLSRPLTEYEAQVVWEFFPLASASEGSTVITVHMMRRPPTRARLAKDVSKISQRAVALEGQHQRILKRYRSAAKAVPSRQGGQKTTLGIASQSSKWTAADHLADPTSASIHQGYGLDV